MSLQGWVHTWFMGVFGSTDQASVLSEVMRSTYISLERKRMAVDFDLYNVWFCLASYIKNQLKLLVVFHIFTLPSFPSLFLLFIVIYASLTGQSAASSVFFFTVSWSSRSLAHSGLHFIAESAGAIMATPDWPGPNSNAQRIKGSYTMVYLSFW